MGKLSKENSLNNLTDLIKFTKNLLQISNRKVKISQSAQDNYLSKNVKKCFYKIKKKFLITSYLLTFPNFNKNYYLSFLPRRILSGI